MDFSVDLLQTIYHLYYFIVLQNKGKMWIIIIIYFCIATVGPAGLLTTPLTTQSVGLSESGVSGMHATQLSDNA